MKCAIILAGFQRFDKGTKPNKKDDQKNFRFVIGNIQFSSKIIGYYPYQIILSSSSVRWLSINPFLLTNNATLWHFQLTVF
jgi:hypothetical protein